MSDPDKHTREKKERQYHMRVHQCSVYADMQLHNQIILITELYLIWQIIYIYIPVIIYIICPSDAMLYVWKSYSIPSGGSSASKSDQYSSTVVM